MAGKPKKRGAGSSSESAKKRKGEAETTLAVALSGKEETKAKTRAARIKAAAAKKSDEEEKEAAAAKKSDEEAKGAETTAKRTDDYGVSRETREFTKYLFKTSLINAKGKGRYPLVLEHGQGWTEPEVRQEIESRGKHANFSLLIVRTKDYEEEYQFDGAPVNLIAFHDVFTTEDGRILAFADPTGYRSETLFEIASEALTNPMPGLKFNKGKPFEDDCRLPTTKDLMEASDVDQFLKSATFDPYYIQHDARGVNPIPSAGILFDRFLLSIMIHLNYVTVDTEDTNAYITSARSILQFIKSEHKRLQDFSKGCKLDRLVYFLWAVAIGQNDDEELSQNFSTILPRDVPQYTRDFAKDVIMIFP